MTGLEIVAAAATALGGAVAAAGTVAAGQAQANAANYNAKALNAKARQEREAAGAEASDFRRAESRKLASTRAARGASGVTMEGSPLMVDDATIREIALGASRLKYRGDVNAARLRDEASLEKMRGKAAKTESYFKAGSSLLTSAGSTAGMFIK